MPNFWLHNLFFRIIQIMSQRLKTRAILLAKTKARTSAKKYELLKEGGEREGAEGAGKGIKEEVAAATVL
jgi:hypothetical protein